MDGVNVAHLHVRAEGNILRRALPAAEYADILHFEVCWLDGMAGDRVVPFLHLLGRGNVYLARTPTTVHFVAMRGVEPTVATLPLSQIDGVEGKGPVPARFFHSHIHGEPDAMRVAKRFEIRARRRRPWQDGPRTDPSAATGGSPEEDLEPKTLAGAGAGPEPVTESDETAGGATSLSTSHSRVVGAATADASLSPLAPLAPPADATRTSDLSMRDGESVQLQFPTYPSRALASEPPPVSAAAPRGGDEPREFRRRDGDPAEPNPTAAVPSFDVRAALAEANERAIDRVQRAVVRAAADAEKKKTECALAAQPGQPAVSDAVVPDDERGALFQTEIVQMVSVERGSQAMYQLECAVLVAHGVKAARDASARDAANGLPVGGVRLAAAQAAATLAARLPVEHLSCLDDFAAVVDAADDAEGGVAAGPVVLAADMARLADHVVRDADGAMALRNPGDDAEDDDAHFLPLPEASGAAAGPEPGLAAAAAPEPSAPEPVALAPGDAPSAFASRLARGTCLSAPLAPALAIAVAAAERRRACAARWRRRATPAASPITLSPITPSTRRAATGTASASSSCPGARDARAQARRRGRRRRRDSRARRRARRRV